MLKSYEGAFGDGNPWIPGKPNCGFDGHLDMFHPIELSEVELLWDQNGFERDGKDNAYAKITQTDKFHLHTMAYKVQRGLFRKPEWSAVICLNFLRERVVFGWFYAENLTFLFERDDTWLDGSLQTWPDMETALFKR